MRSPAVRKKEIMSTSSDPLSRAHSLSDPLRSFTWMLIALAVLFPLVNFHHLWTTVAVVSSLLVALALLVAPHRKVNTIYMSASHSGSSTVGLRLKLVAILGHKFRLASFQPPQAKPGFFRRFILPYIRTKFYMGSRLTELQGDSVQPAFWNFDALFIPQDHPGRDMQDTFYIKDESDMKLARKGLVDTVARTHENGWKTGSVGWSYRWSVEEARRLVLRTHNTVLTVRALSESKEREARVFAVSKIYRNENLDYKHLAEFHQMDGIIVGKGLNVRHLMGFLREFYKKLGLRDVKLWPTYFPYTEPSLEITAYSEKAKDWIELGGSGVFRPEVTWPLGVKVPVLAWGPGIERLMLIRYGLEDLRQLYDSDLGWYRRRPEIASS